MQKVNIKEMARQLNISIATVSKALKDSHEISAKTKQKVLEAAERLNYSPNPYASSLRKKKSKTIAVILPEIADNFFSLAINGIQAIAESKGYHVLIYLSHEKFQLEKTLVEACTSGRVDGVLISMSKETTADSHFLNLQSENIPIVFFDREFEGFNTARVLTNDFECGYIAAEHLIKKNCKRPVFLAASCFLPMCNKRANGFLKGLQTHGIDGDRKNYIINLTGTDSENYEQISSLLQSPNAPDAIVASVEKLAMQVYLACQQQDIRIPQQIKVLAFSTVEIAPILNPPLTTITQPAFEMGKSAAEILFKGIEKPSFDLKHEIICLPSVLIERQSTQA